MATITSATKSACSRNTLPAEGLFSSGESSQIEHAVRNDAKIQPAVYLHSPAKQLMLSGPVECKRKFSLREKSNRGLSARKFNGHHHVCNQKRMFKKYSSGRRFILIR